MLRSILTATLQVLSPLIPLVKVGFAFKSRNLINEALKKFFKVFAFFFSSIFSAFENVDVFIMEADFFRACLIDQHSSACLHRCFSIED